NAPVAAVRHVNTAVRVDCHTVRGVELSISAAVRAPLGDVGAGARELLNAVVGEVRHVDIAGRTHRHIERSVEFSVGLAVAAPLREVLRSLGTGGAWQAPGEPDTRHGAQ